MKYVLALGALVLSMFALTAEAQASTDEYCFHRGSETLACTKSGKIPFGLKLQDRDTRTWTHTDDYGNERNVTVAYLCDLDGNCSWPDSHPDMLAFDYDPEPQPFLVVHGWHAEGTWHRHYHQYTPHYRPRHYRPW